VPAGRESVEAARGRIQQVGMGLPSSRFSLDLLSCATCLNYLLDIPLDLGKCLIKIRNHVLHILNTD
jgi:hypothetical protein